MYCFAFYLVTLLASRYPVHYVTRIKGTVANDDCLSPVGVMIMIHADNQGLVLPPRVACYQV
jgi:hypothetical protein